MKVNVIRGQNQIGGSIIEIESGGTRIILDAGINLGENRIHPFVPDVPGLFSGDAKYDAVFASHYHYDHVGLFRYIVDGIPIYVGDTAFEILKAEAEAKDRELGYSPVLMHPEEPVTVGSITVTPIPCDHSAFAAFMLLVEAEGKKLLYTGDFRSTGYMNYGITGYVDYDHLLERLPKVDILMTEGTTLSRGRDKVYPTERELEEQAAGLLSEYDGPTFIYVSPMSPPRYLTISRAARRTGRQFVASRQVRLVSEASGLDIDMVDRDRFLGEIELGDRELSDRFIMVVTPATELQLERLNRKLSFENGVMLFSSREDYMERPAFASFINAMRHRGVTTKLVHTSGHADRKTITKLIDRVSPGTIIPVHTRNAKWFGRFEDRCRVIYDCKDTEI